MKKLVIVFLVMILAGCKRQPAEYVAGFHGLDTLLTNDIEDTNLDSVFYVAVGKQDTFWYAKDKNDSIYLWAIVKGEGVHLIRDIE